MTDTLTFRTATQAALFECELKGQISDGHWENTPNTDWRTWCKAQVLVGEQVGRNFDTYKDNFNLASSRLVDVVGRRMMGYARLAQAGVALGDIRQLADGFTGLDGDWTGMPQYEGDYWNKVRHWLQRWNQEWVRDILCDPTRYTMTDLMADLKEMKATIRTRKS